MLVKPFLRGLIVVRHHLQGGVRAHFLCKAREFNGFRGGVASGARNHGHAPGGALNRTLHNRVMFVNGKRGRFARRSHRNDAIGAGFDLPVNELFISVKINRFVILHGRDDRRQ